MTVHQIRYRWAATSLLGERGMGPVESTVGERTLRDWDRMLRDHVWAAGDEPGFVYLTVPGGGALIRKRTTTQDGREGSVAHVLFGEELVAEVALGLTVWAGWDAPELTPLPGADVQAASVHGMHDLRRRARALPGHRLAGLFGHWLQAPGAAYTVLGEPDPSAVICALADIVGEIPTFATDERNDFADGLPTAMFLRSPPVSATAATRRRVDPDTPPDHLVLAGFAAAVVTAYHVAGLPGMAPIRPHPVPVDVDEAVKWAEAAQFVPGVLADLAGLSRLGPADHARLTAPKPLKRVRAAAAAATPAVLTESLDAGLPPPLAEILVREALGRAAGPPVPEDLLDALQPFALSPELVAECVPADDLDLLVYVAGRLLPPADRHELIGRVTRRVPLAPLLRWMEATAATDAAAVRAAFIAVRAHLRRPSPEDLGVFAGHRAMSATVRMLSRSDLETSDHLSALLAAIPSRALNRDLVEILCAAADPPLLHALDRVVTGRAGRTVILRRLQQVFYDLHHLGAPTAPPDVSDPEPPGPRWQGPLRRLVPKIGNRREAKSDSGRR